MAIRFAVVLSMLCILIILWNLNTLSSNWINQHTFKCESECADGVDDDLIEDSIDDLSASIEKGEDIYFPKSDHDCLRIFEDSVYANEKQKAPLILDASADAAIDASCEAIRQRVRTDLIPTTKMELDFPIAFVRIVYKDYRLQELLFKLQYAHQNRFCFVIDKKATTLFKEQIKNLTKCFSNAILSRRQLDIDSAGHNMLNGFLDCLRLLLTQPKWQYAITLQNHDIPLRTNFELVSVLKAMNGSNDVSVINAIPERIPNNIQWTYESLQLFKGDSQNDKRSLQITKGSSSCSLSRAFVDFIINKLNVSIFVELFNRMHYGVDEMLFSTLHSNDHLDAPGGYTTRCLNTFSGYITRYVVWKRAQECKSGIERHRVCILGIADLAGLERSRFLFANKMMPDLDYSAISCWAQRLLNRSLTQNRNVPINTRYYSRLPVVRFNRDKYTIRANKTDFRC